MKNSKHAVVIGGNGNIGSAIVSKLAALNYEIDSQWLKKPRLDATKKESYANLPEKIDVAIYIPGFNIISPIELLEEEQWDRIFDVNLKGAFLFAKAAFKALEKANGCFITISSILSRHPYPNRVAYGASKSGLEGFTQGLAVEWGPFGVTTHCIRLGHLSTFKDSWPKDPTVLKAVRDKTPSKRLVTTEDVASYIAWLVTRGAKALNGSIINFDPAYCINRWPI